MADRLRMSIPVFVDSKSSGRPLIEEKMPGSNRCRGRRTVSAIDLAVACYADHAGRIHHSRNVRRAL
jgi:hypothetical protein